MEGNLWLRHVTIRVSKQYCLLDGLCEICVVVADQAYMVTCMGLAEDLGLISLPQPACVLKLAWPMNQLSLFQRPGEVTNLALKACVNMHIIIRVHDHASCITCG